MVVNLGFLFIYYAFLEPVTTVYHALLYMLPYIYKILHYFQQIKHITRSVI